MTTTDVKESEIVKFPTSTDEMTPVRDKNQFNSWKDERLSAEFKVEKCNIDELVTLVSVNKMDERTFPSSVSFCLIWNKRDGWRHFTR